MRQSAGILAYRHRPRGGVELFLVHPGGPYWAKKDRHAWSVPKGEFKDEPPLQAARREFWEETGQSVDGVFQPLPLLRAGHKLLHIFAVETAAPDPERIDSNTFDLEWPPRSGGIQAFPEVDRAAWVPMEEAADKLHKGQAALVKSLRKYLAA